MKIAFTNESYKLFSYMMYSCMIPNDFNFFQACIQEDVENESKKFQPFWTFFHIKLPMRPSKVQLHKFPQGPKNN